MKHIYVITMPGHPYCKIGFAKNLPVRLSSLQTGSPYKIEYFYTCEVEDDIAGLIEADVHLELEEQEVSGEWFEVEPERAKQVVIDCIAGLDGVDIEATKHDLMVAIETLGAKKIANALGVTTQTVMTWPFIINLRSLWRARQVKRLFEREQQKENLYHVFTSVLRGPQNKAAA